MVEKHRQTERNESVAVHPVAAFLRFVDDVTGQRTTGKVKLSLSNHLRQLYGDYHGKIGANIHMNAGSLHHLVGGQHELFTSVCDRFYEILESELKIRQDAKDKCFSQVMKVSSDQKQRGYLDMNQYARVAQSITRNVGDGNESALFRELGMQIQRLFFDFEDATLGLIEISSESLVLFLCRRILVANALDNLDSNERYIQPQKVNVFPGLRKPGGALKKYEMPNVPSPATSPSTSPSLRSERSTAPQIPSPPSIMAPIQGQRNLQDTNTPTTAIIATGFDSCKFHLFTSNRNCCPRDNVISQNEFIFVLNSRFRLNLPPDYPFDSLNSIYKEAYITISRGDPNGPDITGTAPGAAPATSRSQNENLRFMCSELDRAFQAVVASLGPVGAPTNAPTTTAMPFSGSPQPTATLFFRNRCNVAVLLNENKNGMSGIDATEYVRVIQMLADDVTLGSKGLLSSKLSFEALPATLKVPFNMYGTTVIPITGSEDRRSAELDQFCDRVDWAIQRHQNPQPTISPAATPTPNRSFPTSPAPVPTTSPTSSEQPCFDEMAQADLDQSGTLSETEYLIFVNGIDGDLVPVNQTWEEAPYLIRDNYQWIIGVDEQVDIAAAVPSNALPSQGATLAASCHRTRDIVSEASTGSKKAVSLRDHCFASLANADEDDDNTIDEMEFVTFLDRFIGVGQDTAISFGDLDVAFRTLFNATSSVSSGEIDIGGTKPEQTPSEEELLSLNSFCNETERTVATVRSSTVLLKKCRDSVQIAKENDITNNTLTKDEYVVFMYAMTDVDADNTTFREMSETLREFYADLASSLETLDVNAWVNGGSLTEVQLNSTLTTCGAALALAKQVAPPDPADTTTIFGSFIVSNEQGIEATDLGVASAHHQDLASAYDDFVNAEVTLLAGASADRRLRGRRLVVLGVTTNSSELYQIDNSSCPENVQSTGTACQIVYGRFELLYRNEDNLEVFVDRVTTTLQQAIRNGNLQDTLEQINPSSPFTILGPGRQLVPVSSASNDDNLSLLQVSIVGALGILVVVILFLTGVVGYLFLKPKRKMVHSTTGIDGGKTFSPSGATIPKKRISSKKVQFALEEQRPSYAVPFGQYSKRPVERGDSKQPVEKEDSKRPAVENAESDRAIAKSSYFPELSTGKTDMDGSNSRDKSGSDNPWGISTETGNTATAAPQHGLNSSVFSEQTSSTDGDEVFFDHNNVFTEFDSFMKAPKLQESTTKANLRMSLLSKNIESQRSLSSEVNSRKSGGSGSIVSGSDNNSRKSGGSGGSFKAHISEPPPDTPFDEDTGIIDETDEEESESNQESEFEGSSSRFNYDDDDDEEEDQEESQEEDEDQDEDQDEDREEYQDEYQDEYQEEDQEVDQEEDQEEDDEDDIDEEDYDHIEEIDDETENVSTTSDKQGKYRKVVEMLVLEVIPDEIEHLDAMMEQFVGREEELINTLQNMANSTSSEESSEEEDSLEEESGEHDSAIRSEVSDERDDDEDEDVGCSDEDYSDEDYSDEGFEDEADSAADGSFSDYEDGDES